MTAMSFCRSTAPPLAILAATILLALLPGPAHVAGKDGPHWAFQPPRRPAVPRVRQAERARTPIDAFLLSRLEARELSFSSDADRVTLARRAYLDLWGFPPRSEEHTSELQSLRHLVCRLLLERKNTRLK